MRGVYENYLDIVKSIDESLKEHRIIPGLILIYSAIDSFSYLANRSDSKGRSVFKSWVSKWMLSNYPISCDENDIYAARCGILHQLISESDLSNDGIAKEIYYFWGNKKADILNDAIINSTKSDRIVVVKVEDLFWSFRLGLTDCLEHIEKDENWKKSFTEKAKKIFVNVSF